MTKSSLVQFISVAVIAVAAIAAVLAPEAAAQSSCGDQNAICKQRCGRAYCPTCVDKMQICLRTGCWTEIPKYGGARHCNLKKS